MSVGEAREAALALLAYRMAGATICPSEVARSLAKSRGSGAPTTSWRDFMPCVHAAIDQLVEQGSVELSWKEQRMMTRKGPYRISRRQMV